VAVPIDVTFHSKQIAATMVGSVRGLIIGTALMLLLTEGNAASGVASRLPVLRRLT
jgi:hypothetical protein